MIEKAPEEFKQENDVFGRSRPEWGIMHRLKNVLDPENIFAPGRLLQGCGTATERPPATPAPTNR